MDYWYSKDLDDVKTIMLSEKDQFHKVTYCMIPCIYHSWNVPGNREKGHYVSVWDGGGLWGDRTVLYHDC